MNVILALCDLLKLNQEQIRNLNRPITPSEIEGIIKSSNQQKPRYAQIQHKFYQTFKEELIPTLFKLFYKIERK